MDNESPQLFENVMARLALYSQAQYVPGLGSFHCKHVSIIGLRSFIESRLKVETD